MFNYNRIDDISNDRIDLNSTIQRRMQHRHSRTYNHVRNTEFNIRSSSESLHVVGIHCLSKQVILRQRILEIPHKSDKRIEWSVLKDQ